MDLSSSSMNLAISLGAAISALVGVRQAIGLIGIDLMAPTIIGKDTLTIEVILLHCGSSDSCPS